MKRIPLILFFNFLFICGSGWAQSFTNPILAGFYPDPSICKAGNDFYLVNSSFAYYPGLPIFHSKDLVNWRQIGHAMDRPEQLNLDSARVSRGLFAPAISYHNGIFYIVCTLIDKLGNFVITAKDPSGPWSNPVALPQVNGIDPSLFFDNNGKAFLLFNSIPPGDTSLYDGHRTIRMFEFDIMNLKVTGNEKILVNGGTDITKKPVWIEGPHIYKKDGYYYLLCAEGGTAYNHSEVVFRSKQVDGPYESFSGNPILTQRHLFPGRKNPITTTGHADLVELDGKWWAVFLGCRPYEGDYYNTGRETFMAPVEWKDGWPIINAGQEQVQYQYPIAGIRDKNFPQYSGNYIFKDEFNDKQLNIRYSFLRTVRTKWYDLNEKAGSLVLTLQTTTVHDKANPSFIGFRQPHLKGSASTEIVFSPSAENEKAGLMVFQNESHYYFLAITVKNEKPVIALYKALNSGKSDSLLVSADLSIKKGHAIGLKIIANNDTYSFYYSLVKDQWQLLAAGADAKYLSTKEAGGFVGCMYGLYASSAGKPSKNSAVFNWFECSNNDDVYGQEK